MKPSGDDLINAASAITANPGKSLGKLDHPNGVLIDTALPGNSIIQWQKDMARCHGEYLPVSFDNIGLQTRWMKITRNRDCRISLLKTGKE